jgi:hypothetical protein
MKAQFKVNPRLIVEVEAETQKDLFKEIASAAEVFGEKKCGLCGSEQITFAHRTVTKGKKTYEYPEYHCESCHARLSMGSMQEGGALFPIRKLVKDGSDKGKPSREEGEYGNHQGWTKYRGNPGDESKAA